MPDHRAKLRGVGPENLRSTREYAGIKSVGDTQRIEYRDVHGKPHRASGALRNHAPDAPSKYTQPKGTTVHLYIPPFPRASKLRWARIAKDTSVQVAITEGEFKTLCAVSRDIPCIGIAGVDCYQSGGKPLADWAEFEWEQRKSVLLNPDSDYASKPQVHEPRRSNWPTTLLRWAHESKSANSLPLPATRKPASMITWSKRPSRSFTSTCRVMRSIANTWRKCGAVGTPALPKLALEPIASDWLTTELPPIEYTWANWLVRGTVRLLVAEGGTGKTFLNLQLAAAVATGSECLG